MKVVLFCGGFGMRMREYSENIPKPLVHVGCEPILWQVMKYYAHWGHTDFVLCLGWQAEAIWDYFLSGDHSWSNDVERVANNAIEIARGSDQPWRVEFADTGLRTNVGQRLRAVRPLLANEETFLANYADGLSDLPLPRLIEGFHKQRATAAFVAVRPHQTWHSVSIAEDGAVQDIQPISHNGTWMNGGYFVLSQRIFDMLGEAEELVAEPFRRLIDQGKLFALKYDGFWSCMDTYKDKQQLEDMVARGETPWEVWKASCAPESAPTVNQQLTADFADSRGSSL